MEYADTHGGFSRRRRSVNDLSLTVEDPTARFGVGIVPQIVPNGCVLPTNTVTYGETQGDMFRVLSRCRSRGKCASVPRDVGATHRFPSVLLQPLGHLSALVRSMVYGRVDEPVNSNCVSS